MAILVTLPALGQRQAMSAQQAMRLLKLDEQIQLAREAALAEDERYVAARERVEALELALADHRAAFEAKRDADPEYAQAKAAYERVRERRVRLDHALSAAKRGQLDAAGTARVLGGKARQLRQAISRLDKRRQMHQDRYDLISTQTATTVAGYAYLREKISGLESEIAGLQRELEGITPSLDDAKRRQSAAEDDLTTTRQQLLEARAELEKVEPAYRRLEEQAEGRYRGSKRTQQLEADLKDARQDRDTARRIRLAKLRRDDKAYARMMRDRVDIRPYEDD